MKNVYRKLLLEMMSHCRRSDRDLAKTLNISQPTVTRARQWLEMNGFINEYTLIPDFSKIGLELVAFTFVKLHVGVSPEKYEEIRRKAKAFLDSNLNVVMVLRGEGMNCDEIIVSLHRDFSEFTNFMGRLKMEMVDTEVVGNFLASLNVTQLRYLTFKHLKNYLKDGENQE